MIVPEFQTLNNTKVQGKYIQKNYPEFFNYLHSVYPNDLSFTQKLYWYYHNISTYPICQCCRCKRVGFISFFKGYYTYCSGTCRNNSEDVRSKTKKTNLERYGVEWNIVSKESRTKQEQTNLRRYGSKCFCSTDVFQQRSNKTRLERYGDEHYNNIEKTKKTNLERYGVEWNIVSKESRTKQEKTKLEKYNNRTYNNIEKIKRTNLKLYRVANPMKNPVISNKVSQVFRTKEMQDRIYQTKKANHTFNTSKIEVEFKKYLDENNIKYIYQYKSDDYPFVCDFYFPDKDLYLEIQGSWTHGPHPFDSESEEDRKLLALWKSKNSKFYNNAIQTWTIRDVEKRAWAKNKNLNYKEVFTLNLPDLISMFK